MPGAPAARPSSPIPPLPIGSESAPSRSFNAPFSTKSAGFGLNPHTTRFEEVVWPAIAHRIPALETLRLERSCIGHYARNTLDLNAIIGRWRDCNVYLACGYSGHGIMQAPGTGLALSEIILCGRAETLDLTRLGYQRIEEQTPLREVGIV